MRRSIAKPSMHVLRYFFCFFLSVLVIVPADPGPLALEGCDELKRANVFLACFLESLWDALCKGLSQLLVSVAGLQPRRHDDKCVEWIVWRREM